jgi:hypothetical protein
MPMRNEHAAPTFDSSKPRELSQYFEDLEQLMKRTSISDQQDMKKQVLRYVDFSTEQIWKTFPEFLYDNKTYEISRMQFLYTTLMPLATLSTLSETWISSLVKDNISY